MCGQSMCLACLRKLSFSTKVVVGNREQFMMRVKRIAEVFGFSAEKVFKSVREKVVGGDQGIGTGSWRAERAGIEHGPIKKRPRGR